MQEQVLERLVIGSESCPGRIVLEATADGPLMRFIARDGHTRMAAMLAKDGTPFIEQRGCQRVNGEVDRFGSTTITMEGWRSAITLSDSQGKPSLQIPPDKITGYEQWDRIWARIVAEDRQ